MDYQFIREVKEYVGATKRKTTDSVQLHTYIESSCQDGTEASLYCLLLNRIKRINLILLILDHNSLNKTEDLCLQPPWEKRIGVREILKEPGKEKKT